MKKRKILAIALAVMMVMSAVLLVACNKDPETPGEGVVYQTKQASFWAGVGKAYMTFEYDETDGYIFNVKVWNDGEWQNWLSGEWDLNETANTLTLTAEWASGDTALNGGTSGEAKEYSANNGKYTIGIDLPSASNTKITLDPVADKVGEGNVGGGSNCICDDGEPCVADCDKCDGETCECDCSICDPELPTEPTDPTISLEASAEAYGGTVVVKSKLEFFAESQSAGEWNLLLQNQVGEFVVAVDGTYAMSADFTKLELTVVNDEMNTIVTDPLLVAIDMTGGVDNIIYSCTATLDIAVIGELEFVFTNAEVEEDEPMVTLEGDFYATVYIKVELYEDNTAKLIITMSEIDTVINGTWSQTGMTDPIIVEFDSGHGVPDTTFPDMTVVADPSTVGQGYIGYSATWSYTSGESAVGPVTLEGQMPFSM